MSSFLEKEQAKFRAQVARAADGMGSRPPPKRDTVQPSSTKPSPSPAPNSTDTSPQKRKRDTAHTPIYSQASDTGVGKDAFTNVTYIIQYLKDKTGETKTLRDLLNYTNLHNADEQRKKNLAAILRQHGRIEWIPDPKKKVQTWDSGLYKHRPLIAVRNKEELLAYLQRKPDFQGVQVKDLKDGWKDCESAINELELEHKLLVTRTKKDGAPRMVWPNDPTLYHDVEEEFKSMWHQVKLDSTDELVRKLMDAGQKPASEDPSKRVKAAPKEKPKKKRPARKGGRTTNTHMEHLLRDFDHLRG